MSSGYRISNFARQDAADIVSLWTREAGLREEEARRRLDEVLLVATDADGALAGVCTAFLRPNAQLRMDFWHLRVFVARAHRRGEIARRLLREGFGALETREAAGAVVEVENAGVRQTMTEAIWPATQFAFVGENARGAHVRVRYFPGALAPVVNTLAPLPAPDPHWTTELLRGRLDDAWSERVLRFWSANGALDETAGRERLPQVVCALLDAQGEIAGISSAFDAPVPLVGDRRFWIYRNFVLPHAAEAQPRLVAATFAALEAEFAPGGPIGLCLLLAPDEAARRPEAVWEDPTLLYAGYLDDGRQVRVGYFADASVV